jgi:hypothetical protein
MGGHPGFLPSDVMTYPPVVARHQATVPGSVKQQSTTPRYARGRLNMENHGDRTETAGDVYTNLLEGVGNLQNHQTASHLG